MVSFYKLQFFDQKIEISEESEDFKFNSETDNQLNFAIKLFNG